jgi:hypothetical protein
VSLDPSPNQGIFASLASQPGDAVLSRVNKDRSHKPVLQTMTDTVRELGLRGLYRGTVSDKEGGGWGRSGDGGDTN